MKFDAGRVVDLRLRRRSASTRTRKRTVNVSPGSSRPPATAPAPVPQAHDDLLGRRVELRHIRIGGIGAVSARVGADLLQRTGDELRRRWEADR